MTVALPPAAFVYECARQNAEWPAFTHDIDTNLTLKRGRNAIRAHN